MATVQRKLVHKQFNSPIGLYSENNIKSTLNRDLNAFSNGSMGVEVDENAKPLNLANSAVLKLLEEEERQKQIGGVKRVTWPPEHEYQARAASLTRQSPAFQPQYRQPSPHPQYQNGGHNPSGPNPSAQYRQPSPAVNYQNPQAVNYPNQSYQVQQSPSSNNPQTGYQQPGYQQQIHRQPSYQQPQQQWQQPYQGYQQQAPAQSQYPSAQNNYSSDQTDGQSHLRQSTPSHMPAQHSAKPPSCTAAFTGGISTGNKASAKAQNPPNWSHVQPANPVHSGYVQPQYQQQQQQKQQQQPPYYQSGPAYTLNQNQYQPQQTYHQQGATPAQQQQQQYQYPSTTPQPQYQANQSVQPQPQKQYHPENNIYRQPSPGVITLRKELPVSQRPPLIYASEPAAHSFGGGSNMRGDQKWPPEEVKRQSEIENELRRQVALGPATRPRRVNKDYSSFFERHALNSTYPGYRAPPGTQHYGYQYPQYPQHPQYHQ